MTRKLFFIALCCCLVSVPSRAQGGKKSFKAAQKAFSQYDLNTQDRTRLLEAKNAIDAALEDPDMQTEAKSWQVKGDIYNEIITQYVVSRRTGIGTLDSALAKGNPALVASQAYRNALENARKKYEVKDALRGLFAMQGNLSNFGLFCYEDGQFLTAHRSFKEILEIHDILKVHEEKSMMDDADVLDNQIFITGLSALNADRPGVAKPYFRQLYEKQYDKPAIYEAYYQIIADEKGAETAYPILEKGRQRYPDDVSLLFADINHYLKINQMQALIGKLEEAIRAEPKNVSLYFTLGSVYDNLYQKAEEEETGEARLYFDRALKYYNGALSIKPDYFDALYSIGVLYYNQAAMITAEMNELSDDYSQEALNQYDSLKTQVFEQFDLALPYFKRCEQIDPNHLNTLVALTEIFAKRENETELADEFKTRLGRVMNGGQNESSYF